VKEFWIYTLLRLALFLASLGVVIGIMYAADVNAGFGWAVVIAFLVSGVGSYYLLAPQREAFARRVDARAQRASAKIEEMRSKEDAD
jgi:hypothetical protein